MHELETERLRLVPLAEADLDALHLLWTDPDVRRYLWDDVLISREQASEIIRTSVSNFAECGFGFWAMFPREFDSDAIGFCGFRQFEETGEPELLYGVLPRYWGKGLVTEAAHAVVRYGFDVRGFKRIIAATDTPNQSSVRVMQRLGMVFERRRLFHGLDTVFYELTPEGYAEYGTIQLRQR